VSHQVLKLQKQLQPQLQVQLQIFKTGNVP